MALIKCLDCNGLYQARGKRGQRSGRCRECKELGQRLAELHRDKPRAEDSEIERQEREDRMRSRAASLKGIFIGL
jgi:hypothetical protein